MNLHYHRKKVNLYRILQEIIQNTVKHSRATLLNINIHKKDKTIVLKTMDNEML
ncbi:MAG: hypothetical protein WKI04_02355 [Ferruginibacter sp.]